MKLHRHSLRHSVRSFPCRLPLIGVILLFVGCAKKESSLQRQSEPASSTSSSSSSSAAHSQRPASGKLTAAEKKYGVAPPRNDSRFIYEDDVVIVDHGADAVRSLSPNGLIWTIDATAPHADEAQPGKIMFLTSRAVGRVLSAERKGNDLAVILGPVELTDIYKEAHVAVHEPLDLSSAIIYPAPYPGAEDAVIRSQVEAPANRFVARLNEGMSPVGYESRPSGPTPIALRGPAWEMTGNLPAQFSSFAAFPTLQPIRFHPLAPQPLETPNKLFTLTKGDFQLSPCCPDGGIGIRVDYTKGGLEVAADVELLLKQASVVGEVNILPGKGIEAALKLTGVAGLKLGFQAAAGDAGAVVNINEEQGNIVLPYDLSFPLSGAAPFAITVRQHLIMRTWISAKNSALLANAEYTFGGSILMGYLNGSLVAEAPTFSENNTLLTSVGGASLGANALLMGLQNKIILGVGAGGFVAGPYFGYNTSAEITRGSDQSKGFMVPTCTNARLVVSVDAGVGYAIPKPLVAAINFVLGPLLRATKLGELKEEGTVAPLKKEIKNTYGSFPQGCA